MAPSTLPPSRPLELDTVVRALRRHGAVIALALAVGGVVGVAVAAVSPRSYSATAVVRADPLVIDLLDPAAISDPGVMPGQYQEVESAAVLAAAQRRLGPAVDTDRLRDAVSVTQSERGPVLRITATLHEPDLATQAANAVAEEFVLERAQRYRADIDAARARLAAETVTVGDQLSNPQNLVAGQDQVLATRLSELARSALRLDYAATPGGDVVASAETPSGPDGIPAAVTVAAAALLAGGIAVAWAISRQRRRCSDGDLDHLFGPLHVDVPAVDLERRLRDAVLPSTDLERACRELRVRLRAIGTRKVVVLALGPGPSASWLVAVLADLQARFGEPTRVVDFDTAELERWIAQSDGVVPAPSSAIAEPSRSDDSQLVVAAPPLSVDPLGLEVAGHADAVVLVIDEDDALADVVASVVQLRAAGVSSVAAARLVAAT